MKALPAMWFTRKKQNAETGGVQQMETPPAEEVPLEEENCSDYERSTLEAIKLQKKLRTPPLYDMAAMGASLYCAAFPSIPSLSILVGLLVLRRHNARAELYYTALDTADFNLDNFGMLAEMMLHSDRRVRYIARIRLTRLLPLVQKQDIPRLRQSFYTLCSLLTPSFVNRNRVFTTALLECFQKVEYTEALPIVSALQQKALLSCMKDALFSCESVLLRADASAPQTAAPCSLQLSQNRSETAVPVASGAYHTIQKENVALRSSLHAVSAAAFLPYGFWLAYQGAVSGSYWQIPAGILVSVIPFALFRFTCTSRQVAKLQEEARYGSKSQVGALTDALLWPDESARRIARGGLIRLLPHLTAADTRLLNQQQRTLLYSQLHTAHTKSTASFQIAILKALEQIGDENAIPTVQALALCSPTSPSARQVRDAALHCLEFLPQVAQKNSASQQLLRASFSETTSPQQLLRASLGSGSEQTEHLLHPSSPDTQTLPVQQSSSALIE